MIITQRLTSYVVFLLIAQLIASTLCLADSGENVSTKIGSGVIGDLTSAKRIYLEKHFDHRLGMVFDYTVYNHYKQLGDTFSAKALTIAIKNYRSAYGNSSFWKIGYSITGFSEGPDQEYDGTTAFSPVIMWGSERSVGTYFYGGEIGVMNAGLNVGDIYVGFNF